MATTAQQIPIKFCKSLLASSSTTLTPTLASRFFDKALYEFWGFCVNGGESLTVPGGLADVSYPNNFQSGTTLLAAGHDGSTEFGTDIFESLGVDFTSINSGSLYGKYLVLWRPGEDSTDDSVYFIKSVEDPSHIKVDVHSGGTRRLGNHPWFWDRSNIKWRIVDIDRAVRQTGWGDGMYMVLNFVAAPTVNPGQAVPQLKWTHHTGSNNEVIKGMTFSPSGTWSVVSRSFTDGTTEDRRTYYYDTDNGTRLSQALYSFTGGGDFLIGHTRGINEAANGFLGVQSNFTSGSGFHVEIPKRLYPANIDPNPIVWTSWANAMPQQIAATYYDGLKMVARDGTVRSFYTRVRSLHGDQIKPSYTGYDYGVGQWQQFGIPTYRFRGISYDMEDNQYVTTDGILSMPLAGQYSAARVRLRRVRFTTADLSVGARIGDPITDPYGWVHLTNGVLWPWDNSIMPERPWRFGV